jgi:hypothetical protein
MKSLEPSDVYGRTSPVLEHSEEAATIIIGFVLRSLVPQSLNFVISGDDRISAQTYLVIWIFYYVSHHSELQLTSSLMNKSHCL